LAEIDDHVPEVTALTDITKPSYYSVSFSPEAGYYVLGYQGPNIPWQKLFSANDTSE
jgi:dipeptidyl aminopeptidase